MRKLNNYIDQRAGVAQNNARYFAFVIKITRHINAQNLTQSILAIKTCDAGQHKNHAYFFLAPPYYLRDENTE